MWQRESSVQFWTEQMSKFCEDSKSNSCHTKWRKEETVGLGSLNGFGWDEASLVMFVLIVVRTFWKCAFSAPSVKCSSLNFPTWCTSSPRYCTNTGCIRFSYFWKKTWLFLNVLLVTHVHTSVVCEFISFCKTLCATELLVFKIKNIFIYALKN